MNLSENIYKDKYKYRQNYLLNTRYNNFLHLLNSFVRSTHITYLTTNENIHLFCNCSKKKSNRKARARTRNVEENFSKKITTTNRSMN